MHWFADRQVAEELESKSKTISSNEEIVQVGIASANGDGEIGRLIAEATEKVGREGVITRRGSQIHDHGIEVRGMQFSHE